MFNLSEYKQQIIDEAKNIAMADDINRENIINKCNNSKLVSVFGELNAYIFFKKSDFGDKIQCNNDKNAEKPTADFSYNINGKNVNIEINTQEETKSNKKTTHIQAGTMQSKNFRIEIISCCPFGYDKDITLANFISKINNIKEKETQFKEDEVNILFIDLSFLSPLNLLKNHEQPFIIDDKYVIQCGLIWHSVYGNKDDTLFDKIIMDMPFETNQYSIPYQTRFYNKSKIDFIVFNNCND